MVSLLVIVFFLQLIIHLVNSVGAKAVTEFLWQLWSRTPFGTSADIREQLRLRREVLKLKAEMSSISAQDDFARWAKVRRQHDKTMADYDNKAAAVTASRSSFDTKATAIRWIGTTGLRFGLQFWHAKTPIFTYPRGWFPWYVEWALGFPRCPSGGVSINVWSTSCSVAIALVGDVVTSVIMDNWPAAKAKVPEKKVQ